MRMSQVAHGNISAHAQNMPACTWECLSTYKLQPWHPFSWNYYYFYYSLLPPKAVLHAVLWGVGAKEEPLPIRHVSLDRNFGALGTQNVS